MKRDSYKILGIRKNASREQVEKAYRRLARKYHPDVNPNDPGAEKRFAEIAEAYQVLSGTGSRKQYDRQGDTGREPANSGETPLEQGREVDLTGIDFSDLDKSWERPGAGLRDIIKDVLAGTGSRSSASQPLRGADVQYPMEIGFEDAMNGLSATIKLRRKHLCASCEGSGNDLSGGKADCTECNGSGTVMISGGPLRYSRACESCDGEGQRFLRNCAVCGGKGFTLESDAVNVTIPAGVDTGSTIKVPHGGEPGQRGGEPGDLFVITRVRPHPLFTRAGNNLTCEIPLSFPEAALGAKIKVPTLEGNTYVTVPPGTQNGQVLRLSGKGMPVLVSGGRGDLLIIVRIVVPQKLDQQSKNLLQEFARLNSEDVRKHLKLQSMKP